jgi:hypothetical protein
MRLYKKFANATNNNTSHYNRIQLLLNKRNHASREVYVTNFVSKYFLPVISFASNYKQASKKIFRNEKNLNKKLSCRRESELTMEIEVFMAT